MTRHHCLFVATLVAAVAVMTAGVRAQTAASGMPVSVETLFADASAKETAVRRALAGSSPAPTALKAVRTVVADFENLVRRFPSSGYCDDALWRAAQLSRDGFALFGELRDQMTAIRLLQTLQSQYASSKWAKLAPAQLATLRAAVPPLPPSGQADLPLDALPTPERVAASRAPLVSPLPFPRPTETSIAASGRVATIKDIRRATIGDTIRIVVELDMEVAFRDERLEHPARVFVDLSPTRASEKFKEQTIRFESDNDPVRHIRIGRHPNATTRIVLEAAGISSHSVYPLYGPYRLVIDCLRATPAETLAATRPAVAPVAAPPPPVLPVTLPAWLPQSPAVVPLPSPFPVQSAIPSSLVALRFSTFADPLPTVAPSGGAAIADALTDPVPASLPASPVAGAASAVPPPLPLGAPSRNLAGGISIARQLGLSVSRIVIDPGHGGHDSGAKGEGTTEADVVLDIAVRLEKLFERAGDVHVVLTRRDDRYLTLQERTAIANRENADLFLSIHANASSNRQVHGVETYFLNFATNLSAAAVASRENAASGQSMGELPDVVKSIALHSKLDESRDFATFIQREMVARLRPANKELRDLGVKQAPFVVLIGAAMPSVLTEVSFLTNSREAKLLKGPAYRQKIAEALFDGIRKYQSTLGVTSLAAVQSQP